MRERKPLKNPFKINFTGSDDMDLKVKILGDISRFIRENKGRQISIVLEIKKETDREIAIKEEEARKQEGERTPQERLRKSW